MFSMICSLKAQLLNFERKIFQCQSCGLCARLVFWPLSLSISHCIKPCDTRTFLQDFVSGISYYLNASVAFICWWIVNLCREDSGRTWGLSRDLLWVHTRSFMTSRTLSIEHPVDPSKATGWQSASSPTLNRCKYFACYSLLKYFTHQLWKPLALPFIKGRNQSFSSCSQKRWIHPHLVALTSFSGWLFPKPLCILAK